MKEPKMRTLIIVASLMATSSVYAIPVDFSSGKVTLQDNGRVEFLHTGLDNTALAGQNVSLDFTFGSHFLRAFTVTGLLSLELDLHVKGLTPMQGKPPYPTLGEFGHGYFVDAQGQAIGSSQPLRSYYGTDNVYLNAISFINFLDVPKRPLDVYGWHLDLTLPDFTASKIDEDFGSAIVAYSAGRFRHNFTFGVGPNIQTDIVPDGGSTILLLGAGLVALLGFQINKQNERN